MGNGDYQRAFGILAEADQRLERLRRIKPYLLDISLRENSASSPIGHTLADKLALLPQLREFGFERIVLGTLNYAMPDEPEVDDDFMAYLQTHDIDRTGCFALTDIGTLDRQGAFTPSDSLLKLKAYGVPNTLQEIYLTADGMAGRYDAETLRRSLPASIEWVHEHIHGDRGAPPKIIVNLVDGFDIFPENPALAFSIISLLAEQPIEGISLEDARGTYLPFQVGAYVAAIRELLPASMKLLVHLHAAAGYENASVVEALLNGADGAWGGLTKNAAVSGHASLGELIANLVRAGNPHMGEYRIEQLLPLAHKLQQLNQELTAGSAPVLGAHAYRLPNSVFRQKTGRFMDLPPEAIGGKYAYRICPEACDPGVIAGRLAEIMGGAPESLPSPVLAQMIRLMRRSLRGGKRIVYDKPEALLALYLRAKAEHEQKTGAHQAPVDETLNCAS